jgi:hypothetical protein
MNLLSGFARQGAEAQSLFGFATDLTNWADFHRFFCRWWKSGVTDLLMCVVN